MYVTGYNILYYRDKFVISLITLNQRTFSISFEP